jgi:phenylalanyl-tRNA synthetase alpha chain
VIRCKKQLNQGFVNAMPSLASTLDELHAQATQAVDAATDLTTLDAVRVYWLGKKGQLTQVLKGLKDLSEAERKAQGARANQLQQHLNMLIEQRKTHLQQQDIAAQIEQERLDVTLPGVVNLPGSKHPVTQVTEQLVAVLNGLGFFIVPEAFSPEVETEYYNFDALNFPANHPARDMQDTFYTDLAPHIILRSQTSNAQVRFMEKNRPPIQIISPGRVFRNESVNSRKHVQFHQLEGLWVDKGIGLPELKGVLTAFVSRFFGDAPRMRFRNSYFPFTEPSLEIDIWSEERHSWLEILGAGLVDPNVLQMAGIDPEVYSGFAFGVGIERMAMLKYGIADIRWFYENDVRFLRGFTG